MLSEAQQKMLYEAHGSMNSIAWAVIFPLGAIMIRLVPSKKAWIIHGGIMLFGLLLFTSGFGIGLNRMMSLGESVGSAAHYIIGTILFAMVWLQPILGMTHHYLYKASNRRSIISTIHVFFGRLLMLVGIVNGGVGLLLAGYSTRAENIAYGTVVSIIWVTYILVSLYHEAERDNEKKNLSTRNTSSGSSETEVEGEQTKPMS